MPGHFGGIYIICEQGGIMRLKVTADYLWLPVDMSGEEKTMNIYADGKLVQEIRIRLAADRCDFYGAWK